MNDESSCDAIQIADETPSVMDASKCIRQHLNGKFKMSDIGDYEAFLDFQGAPWPVRRAILLDKNPVVTIAISDTSVHLKQIGIVWQDIYLEFDKEPIENKMMLARRCFRDSVHRIPNGFRITRADMKIGTKTIIDRTIDPSDLNKLCVKMTATKEDGTSCSSQMTYYRVNQKQANESSSVKESTFKNIIKW